MNTPPPIDTYKQDYCTLHIDLVNAIVNLQLAERHLRIASCYINETPDRDAPLQLDSVSRASLGTGINMMMPMIASLLSIAEAAKVPCERRYPHLVVDSTRVF